MPINLNEFLYSLAQFDPAHELEQINPPPATINDLRIRFLELNSELYSIYSRNLKPDAELKTRLNDLNARNIFPSILEKIDDTSPDKEALATTIENFKSIAAQVSTLCIPSIPMGMYTFQTTKQAAHNETCTLFGDVLIDTVKQIKSSDAITEFSKQINLTQTLEIVLSEECDSHLPRLLTSLPPPVFFNLLLNITDNQASALNRKFMCVRDEGWFAEKFKIIRENFINVSNTQAKKIDELNRELRRMHLEDISKATIAKIEELREETKRAWEAQQRLQILMRNVVVDKETQHLFKKELPIRYIGLINRLSDREEEQKFVSGCPYGIIYRISFDDYEQSDDEDVVLSNSELQNELLSVICTWIPNWRDWVEAGIINRPDLTTSYAWKQNSGAAYLEGIENLKKWGIASIKDLKTLLIFNSAMLKEYIREKKTIIVDDEVKMR